MDWLTFIVELVRATAWPASIAIIAVVFKNEIKSLLPRIRKAGPTGVELDAAQQQKVSKETLPRAELTPLPGLDRTPAMAAIEKQLHDSLALIAEEKQTDVLIRLLAQSRLETAHEQTFLQIFGSQLALLRKMQSAGSRSLEEIERDFSFAKLEHPDAHSNRTFEEWLGFLLIRGLLRPAGKMQEITDLGRDFLMYLDARHYGHTRPF